MAKTKTLALAAFAATLSLVSGGLTAEQCEKKCESGEWCCPTQCCNECGSFFARADWLYWKACTGGSYVATLTERQFNVPSSSAYYYDKAITNAQIKHYSDEWDSGVRLGVGYESCDKCWSAGVNWTYFDTSSDRTVRNPSKELRTLDFVLAPYSGLGLLNDIAIPRTVTDTASPSPFYVLNAEAVKSNYSLNLNIVDFELGRTLCMGPCFRVRPHVDLRYVNIEQDNRVKSSGSVVRHSATYSGTPNPNEPTVIGTFTSSESFSNDFDGLGPRFGVSARWELGCNWGVYGDVAAALVYGDRDSADKISGTRNNLSAGTQTGDDSSDFFERRTYHQNCSRAITDAQIGLYYEGCMFDGDYDYSINLGWEHHMFFNQGLSGASPDRHLFNNQVENAYVYDDHNLSLQGLTVSAQVGF